MIKPNKLEKIMGRLGLATILFGLGNMAYQAFDSIHYNHKLNDKKFLDSFAASNCGALMFSYAMCAYIRRKGEQSNGSK